MTLRRCSLLILAASLQLVALAAAAGAASLAAEKAPSPARSAEFTLTDQESRTHRFQFPREKLSVLVLADQKGSKQIEGWIAPIFGRYGEEIDIAGVAALPGIPAAFQGLFRREFRKQLRYPVMLDWSGTVAQSFGYRGQVAHLLVIGKSGRILVMKLGEADAGALGEVFKVIDWELAR